MRQILCCLSSCSYIKPQRSSRAYSSGCSCLSSCSYIKPQPSTKAAFTSFRCLSSCSYIKPQPASPTGVRPDVVYHLVPTSNHNSASRENPQCLLFIILFLHQTTTRRKLYKFPTMLFIILFLHQTTTIVLFQCRLWSCLSSCSYIKPQLPTFLGGHITVVYHLVPTSNHNAFTFPYYRALVVYHLVPTSNHNFVVGHELLAEVVYHLVPTSNHNSVPYLCRFNDVVYHLVPTSNHNLVAYLLVLTSVVYHLVPTSNHNRETDRTCLV